MYLCLPLYTSKGLKSYIAVGAITILAHHKVVW